MSEAVNGPVPFFHLLLLLLLLHVSSAHPLRLFGRIAENSPAGTPVAGVALRAGGCPGSGPNAGLRGSYASDFRLVYHRGRLALFSSKALDREFIAMYELTVELPPRCLRRPAALQVEVTDENDNTPRFTGGNHTVEVDELTQLGTELARFDARDDDADRNGRVTFYASPKSHLLHVVPQSGQVRLVGSLLGVSQVTLRLYVKDGGDEPLTGEPVFLRVTVRRSGGARRRHRALPEEQTYTVTVPDHVRVGDLVFTVPDQRFEQRWFEVIPEAESPVHIERASGRLYLARKLREAAEVVVKVHRLRGTVTDVKLPLVCVNE